MTKPKPIKMWAGIVDDQFHVWETHKDMQLWKTRKLARENYKAVVRVLVTEIKPKQRKKPSSVVRIKKEIK